VALDTSGAVRRQHRVEEKEKKQAALEQGSAVITSAN